MPTNHEKKKYDKSLGIDATVQRATARSDDAKWANEQLRHIGEKINPLPHGYVYRGSACFHVYTAEGTGVIETISQTATMQDCNELYAITALQNFSGDLIQFYGHKRPGALRSGF